MDNTKEVLKVLTQIDDNLNVLNGMFYIFLIAGGLYLFWKGAYKLLMRFA